MDLPKDKVILDLTDHPDLQDYFSTKEPGDECELQITATVDENANKIVTLSITKSDVVDGEEGEEKDPADEAEDKADGGADEAEEEASEAEPAVMAWSKGKKAKGE